LFYFVMAMMCQRSVLLWCWLVLFLLSWNCASVSSLRYSYHRGTSSAAVLADNNSALLSLSIDWANVTAISKTIATLQVVANPLLNSRTSPVAHKIFHLLEDLQADLVRYVPWRPYPLVAVAELDPPNPTQQTTSWNFTLIEQQFYDTFHAVVTKNSDTIDNNDSQDPSAAATAVATKKKQKKRLVINFSTQPTWMFNTSDWSYNSDPNQANWHYSRGQWLPNYTTKLVAEYYGRLASWIIHGRFQDEFGHDITGGPAFGDDVTHWEIFNEPEKEHDLNVSTYNLLYDSIVQEIRTVADHEHRITFVGVALMGHANWEWWEGFLTLENHAREVRDAVAHGLASFHFYATPPSRTNVSTFSQTFHQIDGFLRDVDRAIAIRDRLSPTTGLALNELGVIPPHDNQVGAPPSPPLYFNMVAGVFTIILCELTAKGVDVVGSSQLCGCPEIPLWDIPDRQYPGVSMTNWTTGEGNPRYWALKLYLKFSGAGDRIVYSNLTFSSHHHHEQEHVVYSQARITYMGEKVIILVNKSNQQQKLMSPELTNGAIVHIVDGSTHDKPWKTFLLKENTILLEPFAVSLVRVQLATRSKPNDPGFVPQTMT
jgi:hypothetical protein